MNPCSNLLSIPADGQGELLVDGGCSKVVVPVECGIDLSIVHFFQQVARFQVDRNLVGRAAWQNLPDSKWIVVVEHDTGLHGLVR